MKQQICEQERQFIVDGFKQGIRSDGRANIDSRQVKVNLGTIQEAFGSATVVFGETDTQIICAIKAEIQKPLDSEPSQGQIAFHLESSQTGSSLFMREQDADLIRNRMAQII